MQRAPEEILTAVTFSSSRATSLSGPLWKEFCVLTGKTLDSQFADKRTAAAANGFESLSPRVTVDEEGAAHASDGNNAEANMYRTYYFRNPCVPVDFPSINEALGHCPRAKLASMRSLGDEATSYSDTGTVVLLPGEYEERIVVSGRPWTVGQSAFGELSIRAAFPSIGATIRSPRSVELASDGSVLKDMPCISISTCDEDTLDGAAQKCILVRLSHLRILHSTRGADIWNGNTAVIVEGPRAQVIIDSCIMQSSTGRGVVVTQQAVCELYGTTIVDCAATGFYLGDWGSRAMISGCNIIRNGFGNQETVPSGHSGVYVESSMAWVEDSLVAGNCLTGLSVVRGGFLSLSDSDITENGQTAILIEDAHDLRDPTRLQGLSIRGGVVEGPRANNYTKLAPDGTQKLFKGGVVRAADTSYVCEHLDLD